MHLLRQKNKKQKKVRMILKCNKNKKKIYKWLNRLLSADKCYSNQEASVKNEQKLYTIVN